MAKKELTLSEFREIIKEEALKLKKRIVLENEKKALMAELKTLNENCGDGEIEEGFFRDSPEEKLKKAYEKYSKAWRAPIDDAMMADLMAQAKPDGYEGAPGFDKSTKTWSYRPSSTVSWSGGVSGSSAAGMQS